MLWRILSLVEVQDLLVVVEKCHLKPASGGFAANHSARTILWSFHTLPIFIRNFLSPLALAPVDLHQMASGCKKKTVAKDGFTVVIIIETFEISSGC